MLRKKKTIHQLFEIREKVFAKATADILSTMGEALEAVHEYMDVVEFEKVGGKLTWENISLVEDGMQSVLILTGIAGYPTGTEIELNNGEKVKVTESTAPYFHRVVRIGLPLEVAHKSKDEVLAHLAKMEAEERNQTQLQFMDAEEESNTEFDLSKLTPEQRQAYQAGVMSKPGKA